MADQTNKTRTDAECEKDARRQRRRQARKRHGETCFRGALSKCVLHDLTLRGLITADEAGDQDRLGQAVAQFLDQVARGQLKPSRPFR